MSLGGGESRKLCGDVPRPMIAHVQHEHAT